MCASVCVYVIMCVHLCLCVCFVVSPLSKIPTDFENSAADSFQRSCVGVVLAQSTLS